MKAFSILTAVLCTLTAAVLGVCAVNAVVAGSVGAVCVYAFFASAALRQAWAAVDYAEMSGNPSQYSR